MIEHAASTISAHAKKTSSLHVSATDLEGVNKNDVSSDSTPETNSSLCDNSHDESFHHQSQHKSVSPELVDDSEFQQSQPATVVSTPNPSRSHRLSGTPIPSLPTIHSSSKIEERERSESFCSRDSISNSRRRKRTKWKRKRRRMVQSSQMLRNVVSISPRIDADADLIVQSSNSNSNMDPQRGVISSSVDQFECVLRRRAIQKKQVSTLNFMSIPQPKSRSKSSIIPDVDIDQAKVLRKHGIDFPVPDDDDLEIEGDTSLGMKLTILSGKVIVQKLVSLQDGRASPAQLIGNIARGDILLSIDDQSLVGLGNLDLLLKRLAPLSTPNENGRYNRRVRVKFAVGEGLKLLVKDDESLQRKQQKKVEKKYNLDNYTMVDQLSGNPLFKKLESGDGAESKIDSSQLDAAATYNENAVRSNSSQKSAIIIPLNQSISIHIAMERQRDKVNFTSRYFSMNDEMSSLLRPMEDEIISGSFEEATKKQEELLNMGKRALTRAKYLFNQVELGPLKRQMDPLRVVRNECRSFSSRSRFSQKYAYQNHSDDEESDEDSSDNDSMIENDINGEGEIGDEMLLRLAVWNRSWKKRMVETLEAASIHTREKTQMESEENKENKRRRKKDDNLESQLQNLLFGSEVTEMMNKKKPTVALPPDEITEVLFDLATRVSATIPTNVSIVDGFDTSLYEIDRHDSIALRVPNSKVDMEVLEATRFLLDDILPAWMDTFKPIPNHQRRVVWPLAIDSSSSSTPDDLSMESAATGWSTGSPERRAKLEDQIAHLELDADTKIETCELVTFYFTRKIIPDITMAKEEQSRDADFMAAVLDAEDAAVKFIKSFGSYLKLFESFVATSLSQSKTVMQSLLSLSKNDPSHKDGMKQLTRNAPTLLYEPKFLSCLLIWLENILNDVNGAIPERLLSLLVGAYPDIKPWQVRSQIPSFIGVPGEIIEGDILQKMELKHSVMYYVYLSLLMDSSHIARMDRDLVREWCIMSTSDDFKSENEARRENFYRVVKRESSSYHRDLPFLIDTSVIIQDTALTLELVDEIISESNRYINGDGLKKALAHLMSIAHQCIHSFCKDEVETMDQTILRQVLVLLNRMKISTDHQSDKPFFLSDEILKLLTLCTTSSRGEEEIVRIITESVAPDESLRALSLWKPSSSVSMSSIVFALRKSLSQGIGYESLANNGEISMALSRVREIRQQDSASHEEDSDYTAGMTIWETMEKGMDASINK